MDLIRLALDRTIINQIGMDVVSIREMIGESPRARKALLKIWLELETKSMSLSDDLCSANHELLLVQGSS